MRQHDNLALRRQILLKTARLQQSSVQLQLDRLSNHQAIRLVNWVGGAGVSKRQWVTGLRLASGVWRTGVNGLVATALARLIQHWRAS